MTECITGNEIELEYFSSNRKPIPKLTKGQNSIPAEKTREVCKLGDR